MVLSPCCLFQGKILDLTGHGKNKEKSEKESKKDSKGKSKKNFTSFSASATGGSEDVDSSEADLVAILANQVVKDENKKLRPGFRAKKKSNKTVIKKKISKFVYMTVQGSIWNGKFSFWGGGKLNRKLHRL